MGQGNTGHCAGMLYVGAERARSKAAAGGPSEVADCGVGQARLQLADPAAPYLCIDKLGGTAGERSRPRNPGL